MKPRLGDIKWNLERHIELAKQAQSGGSHMIVFPELSLTGYSVRDLNAELALDVNNKFFDPLKTLSAKISIAVGTIIRDASGGIRNGILFFEDGEIRHVHYKVYLPTYGLFEEQRYFLPGNKVEAFDTKFGRVGLLVCEDLWHISLPYLLAEQGARLIIGVAASPTRLSGPAEVHSGQVVNSEQHRAFARLLSVYLAFVNRVGFEDGVNFWGGSEVISPHGDNIATGKLFDEELITSEIVLAEVDRARLFARHFLDENPALVVSHLKDLGYR